MNLTLDHVPSLTPLYLKAMGTTRRKPAAKAELPRMNVTVEGVRFDASKLGPYREICGFPEGGGVPIPYPQVHAFSLQMHLLLQPQFPLPLLGLVHLKNRITQERELQPDESFKVTVALVGERSSDKGVEFDVQTVYTDAAGKDVWSSVATPLYRRKGGQGGRKAAPPPAEGGQLSEYKAIDAPVDIGRRYGRISGDMNPIHLYPLTAKLLGFQRHIAHGMWSMARCCALLQGSLGRPPRELTTKFIQPLFLPARTAMRYGPAGDGYDFTLLGRDSGKTHLIGQVR